MKTDIQTKLKTLFDEKIKNRKAMFIPIAGVAAFMLVGYAGVDHEKPEIVSSHIQIPYGEKFDTDAIEVVDNHDSRSELLVEADDDSLDVKQLGTYQVEVRATDQFNNTDVKTIQVDVVDEEAPKLKMLGANDGYYIEVPVYGSQDLSSYIKAVDNVDGDVTPFIESDKQLDTSKQGTQTIYVSISDNLDTNIEPKVEETIDTKQLNQQKEMTIIATDGAGNSSKVTLNATVKDITGPNIVLSTNKVSVDKGSNVDLKSYITSAVDNLDGDMKDKISFNTIDTSTTGVKTVTYTGVDSAGNKSEVQLQVEVTFSGERIVNTGLSKTGCPYVWGSTGPNSFDCSGFTQWVYRQNGIYIPRTSSEQKAAAKKVVSLSELEVGDILWRSGHVGIYIGNGQYVHAPHTGDVVKVSSGVGKFTCGLRYQ